MASIPDHTRWPARPLLLVLSAPSGGGKTTLCRLLRDAFPAMRYSVSWTTRPPRGDEKDGQAYHFVSEPEFARRVARGDFLEHARVHGHGYGTSRDSVESALRDGQDILLDIDVQGARSVRRVVAGLAPDALLRRAYVDVFVAPPSQAVLAQRLRDRGEDDEAVIARRLRNAHREMAAAGEYQYRMVNDGLQTAFAALQAIVVAEHHRNPQREEPR